MKNKLNIRKLIGWMIIIGLFLTVFVIGAILYGLGLVMMSIAYVITAVVVLLIGLGITINN
jgi:hypothetical protein